MFRLQRIRQHLNICDVRVHPRRQNSEHDHPKAVKPYKNSVREAGGSSSFRSIATNLFVILAAQPIIERAMAGKCKEMNKIKQALRLHHELTGDI